MMEIVGLAIAAVGTIAAIIAAVYAIVAVRVAKKVASSQEQLQREPVKSQEIQQRRRETLQACEALRELLDRWYRALAENIDPALSPQQILTNITKLDSSREFQSRYETLIGRIRAAHEPLCDPLLQNAQNFREVVLQGKLDISTDDVRLMRG